MPAQNTCKELVKFFIKEPTLIDNFHCFSQELGISHADFKQLNFLFTVNKISAEELFLGFLHKWITQQSEQPTLSNPLSHLLISDEDYDLHPKLRDLFMTCVMIFGHTDIIHQIYSDWY